MPQKNSIVLYAFELPPLIYSVGDTFVRPNSYSDEHMVDLWLRGWISDLDVEIDQLNPEMQEKLNWPEWVHNRKQQLTGCHGCR